jgi:Ser/Thr protein kinase RdoA (MazF antagonist)
LVELQADHGHGLGEGGWDVSWWIGVVLFEGWEHWWAADAAVPQTSRRLRAFLEPAWGHRLPAVDLVHGDLSLTNVLASDGVITRLVDWDDVGLAAGLPTLAGCCWTGIACGWPAGRVVHHSRELGQGSW